MLCGLPGGQAAGIRIERAAAPPCRKPLRACKSVQAGS